MKRNRCALIAAIIALLLLSCAHDREKFKEKAEASMNVGIASIQVGDFGTALKELLRAQELNPDDPRIYYYLSLAYQGKGYLEKAIEEGKKAVEKKKDYSEAYNLLGTLYMAKGELEHAMGYFYKALENVTYETPSLALYNLGRVYFLQKQYEKALKCLEEAAAKDFRGEILPLIEYTIGEVRYVQGDLEKASIHFKRATELAPLYGDAYFMLGMVYRKQGREAAAAETWKKLITLMPDSEAARRAKEEMSR